MRSRFLNNRIRVHEVDYLRARRNSTLKKSKVSVKLDGLGEWLVKNSTLFLKQASPTPHPVTDTLMKKSGMSFFSTHDKNLRFQAFLKNLRGPL